MWFGLKTIHGFLFPDKLDTFNTFRAVMLDKEHRTHSSAQANIYLLRTVVDVVPIAVEPARYHG